MEKQKGSIFKWLLVLVAVILVLSYFGFDLKSFLESETVSNNFSYLKEFFVNFWNNYLAEYFHIFWNYINPLFGPAIDKIKGTSNALELLNEISVPEPASIIPEVTGTESTVLET